MNNIKPRKTNDRTRERNVSVNDLEPNRDPKGGIIGILVGLTTNEAPRSAYGDGNVVIKGKKILEN